MNNLTIILIITVLLSVLFTYLSLITKKTAFQIVNEMDFGWTMARAFECYDSNIKIDNPNDQITLWGNPVPTKEIFIKLKKYGFKTIRFPVTWMHFMDEPGKVDSKWMSRVKQIVDWIMNYNMYCILNIHHDGSTNNWLTKGETAKEKFIFLWQQIAEEFKAYDEHLIFECMNDIVYSGDYNYTLLFLFNQGFVDIVRSSGGYNKDRLLILSGANKNIDLICSSDYKIPIDPSNKIAISIHYYIPVYFTVEKDDDPWYSINENGEKEITVPMTKWGNKNDYNEMFSIFRKLKETFIDKGIPIVITETGVFTEQKKEIESIREYLFFAFSMSASYKGLMTCLLDESNRENGDMNYFDRSNYKWFDEKIGENFKKIKRRNFIKPTDYYISSNKETVTDLAIGGTINLKIGKKKVLKVIFNVEILTNQLWSVGFGISSKDKAGVGFGIKIGGLEGKRQYDGSYTFTYDVSDQDINEIVEIQKWWGQNETIINYLTVEFNQSYTIFNYESYKSDLKLFE